MRLYRGRIPAIATDIVRTLVAAEDIETDVPKEVEADVASVLTTYLNTEHDVSERAKDLMQSRGLGRSDFGRLKRAVAEEAGIKIGDEALDYVLDQIAAMLMYSANVEEIYAEDVELRRKMAVILKRESAVDDQVEQETRARIRHVEEGTPTWEIEYRRVMEEIRRRKGL